MNKYFHRKCPLLYTKNRHDFWIRKWSFRRIRSKVLRNSFLALFVWLPVSINAQLTLPDIPSNSELASRFELSTEKVFRVNLSETYLTSGALIAYINGEIRGAQTASVRFPSTGIKVYKIMIFNDKTGDDINYKYYDIFADKVYYIKFFYGDIFEFVHNQIPDYANPNILTALTPITQDISLTTGWNIISFAVEMYESMMLILNPLISAGTFIKAQDENGNAIEQLPAPIGWIDNIRLMRVSEGYKIKVSANTTLSIIGKTVTLPYIINLSNGWNIMGYPSMSSQPALAAFQSLINDGRLLKVQDEKGNAIEQLPAPIGWVDNIHTLASGEGYKVKVSTNTSITINNTGKGEYESAESVTLIKPSHFKPAYTGKGLDHMNIYLQDPSVGGAGIKAGDEIGVFDGNRCVGAATVEDPTLEYLMVTASLDDPTTQEADGFTEGNSFDLRLWDSQKGMEKKTQSIEVYKGYDRTFEKFGTSYLTVDFEEILHSLLGDAYPNPSPGTTTFTFHLADECKVRLEILNVMGELVKVLIDRNMPGGSHEVQWDNISAEGSKAKTGIYFYRLRLNDFMQTKSLVIH